MSQMLNKKKERFEAQHKQPVATKNKELYDIFLETKHLIYGRYFQPIDVDGDGNCLFNALLASGHLPSHDHTSLCQAICNYALNSEKVVIKKIYDGFQRSGSSENFQDHFFRMRNDSVHAGMTEMFVAYLLFNINVISYTNQLYEFKPQLYPKLDVKELLESNLKKDGPFHTMKNVKTIHNFHHVYKIPH